MNITLDKARLRVTIDGHHYHVDPRETQLLELLLPGRLVTYADIQRAIWRGANTDKRNAIQTYSYRLRQLGVRVITIHGKGLILDCPMTDQSKTQDIVQDTAFKARRAVQEAVPGSKRADFSYDKETGVGTTTHSTDDCQIDIVVTPHKEKTP